MKPHCKIIVILLDENFSRLTAGYEYTEKAIAWFNEWSDYGYSTQKSATSQTFQKSEPKIIFMKPTAQTGYLGR